MAIKNIQFKRITGYKKSFNDAVAEIKTRIENNEFSLSPGEPLVCAYSSGSDQESFFLAIGTICKGGPTIKVFPAFTDLTDFENFVKSKCGSSATFDLEEKISEESDISVEKTDSGKYILKIKEGIIPTSGGGVWEKLPE